MTTQAPRDAGRRRRTAKRIGSALAAAAVVLLAAAPVAWSTGTLTPKQALVQGRTIASTVPTEKTATRLIVRFRDSAVETRRALLAEYNAVEGAALRPTRDLAGGASLVALGRPMPLSQAKAVAARLAANPAVEYAEPDILMKPLMVPNDPRYGEWQWNLYAPTTTFTGNVLNGGAAKSAVAAGGANMPTAWDVSRGGSSSVVVAVIDTGIVNHPDLNGIAQSAPYTPAGRFVAGYDFVSSDAEAGAVPLNFIANDGDGRDPDPTDPGDWITAADTSQYPTTCPDGPQSSSWHGTHMAGILAATTNNSLGVAGVAWNVRVQPIRALGKCGGSLSDIAEAIRWAAGIAVPNVPQVNSTPAKVISLSLGGTAGDPCSQEMQSAIDAVTQRGVVVVAATGNDGGLGLISPASCNGVIAVTAHTINGENADYANVGASTTISAPGGGPPTLLGAGTDIDDKNWTGYYIWSTLLFGATTPDSTDSQGRSGPGYGGFTGTSAATPHVAGVAALIRSVLPTATPAQIRTLITSTARPFPAGSTCASGNALAGQCGAGLLDATAALNGAVANAPPLILDGPASMTVVEGQAATLTVAAAGASTLTYQWKRNGTNIPGATSESYVTPALTLADSGAQFSVTVTNSLGSVTSPVAVVTVVQRSSGGGGGGGGAVPAAQVLLLAALLLASRLRRRE